MIAYAEISIGTGPETPCERCGRTVRRSPRSVEPVLHELAQASASWASGPGPNVAFVGIEPFSHPELPALVHAATESGFERIRVTTDAGALGMSGNAEGVVRAGVTHIEVVVLGGHDTHDTLCGRRGLFDAARTGVAAFRSAAAAEGVPVVVSGRVPMCRHNMSDAVGAVAALAEMGAVLATLIPVSESLDPDVVVQAEQAAVVSGMWLHAPGVSVLPPPVRVVGASQ